jgi:hypothetical protein
MLLDWLQKKKYDMNFRHHSKKWDLLEYLVAEGYADTNESALVIMALVNMSEEWRQSIVEGDNY